MTTREEFLDREASAWAAFEVELARVPAEDRDRPGVVEGWSVKDMVWHCAYWASFATQHLEASRESDAPFEDPFDAQSDEHWDEVNAEVARTSASMPWNDVIAGTATARADLRDLVGSRDLDPDVLTWAADETFIHYDEHAQHVRTFADSIS
jgi:hypothetical protein